MVHTCQIQVRFKDIDQMGHVNNSVYFTYAEQARMYFFDQTMPYLNWREKAFIVAKMEANYHLPVLLHDKVEIKTTLEPLGNKSVTLNHELMVLGSVRCTLKSILVAFDYKQNKSISLSQDWKASLMPYVKQDHKP